MLRLQRTASTLAAGSGTVSRTPGREPLDGTAEQGYLHYLHCGLNAAGNLNLHGGRTSAPPRYTRPRAADFSEPLPRNLTTSSAETVEEGLEEFLDRDLAHVFAAGLGSIDKCPANLAPRQLALAEQAFERGHDRRARLRVAVWRSGSSVILGTA